MAHAATDYDQVLMIHVVPFMVDAGPVIARLAELAASAPLPLMHSMMGTLPGKADWFATMERAGVPMFNDVEEMAEAAGLLARYPALRESARNDVFCPRLFFAIAGVVEPKNVCYQSVSPLAEVLHFCNFLLDMWIFRGIYHSGSAIGGEHRPGSR